VLGAFMSAPAKMVPSTPMGVFQGVIAETSSPTVIIGAARVGSSRRRRALRFHLPDFAEASGSDLTPTSGDRWSIDRRLTTTWIQATFLPGKYDLPLAALWVW
jgi:hypothetical protein